MKDSVEKMSSLLIMDDLAASLKNLEIQMLLKKIIFNRRHYRLSIICLVQCKSERSDAKCRMEACGKL